MKNNRQNGLKAAIEKVYNEIGKPLGIMLPPK
jgi:hypothetical protein